MTVLSTLHQNGHDWQPRRAGPEASPLLPGRPNADRGGQRQGNVSIPHRAQRKADGSTKDRCTCKGICSWSICEPRLGQQSVCGETASVLLQGSHLSYAKKATMFLAPTLAFEVCRTKWIGRRRQPLPLAEFAVAGQEQPFLSCLKSKRNIASSSQCVLFSRGALATNAVLTVYARPLDSYSAVAS